MIIAKFVSDICLKISNFLLIVSRKVFKSDMDILHQKWVLDQGDKTLRINYNLDENSIIFDLGGYEGQWASDIFSKYCCTIHIFEPIEEFANNLQRRFKNNRRIIVHNFGLANETKKIQISVNKDSSSIHKKGMKMQSIFLYNVYDFLNENNIQKIDLMKINIEGAEYDLLEFLIKIGYIPNIINIQIQFHDFIPNAYERRNKIHESLRSSHKLTYEYPFIWENWEKI